MYISYIFDDIRSKNNIFCYEVQNFFVYFLIHYIVYTVHRIKVFESFPRFWLELNLHKIFKIMKFSLSVFLSVSLYIYNYSG